MLAGLAGNRHEHDLIAHLCQQIAALRQIAAQHSPGDPSVRASNYTTNTPASWSKYSKATARNYAPCSAAMFPTPNNRTPTSQTTKCPRSNTLSGGTFRRFYALSD